MNRLRIVCFYESFLFIFNGAVRRKTSYKTILFIPLMVGESHKSYIVARTNSQNVFYYAIIMFYDTTSTTNNKS